MTVEPSCGSGAFLVPIVERVIESCRRFGRPLSAVQGCLVAFDLLPTNAELARKVVAKLLTDAGANDDSAQTIAAACVREGDFLLTDHGFDVADFVLGNPPYIRLEDVPTARSDAYRRACITMRGRSDIYVGFIEMGLRILKPRGVLGFIVADRWMHNQYGADLRRMVTDGFAVETVLAMHDVDAFEAPVSAHPAVTMIRRAPQSTAVVANAGKAFDSISASALTRWVRSPGGKLSNNTTSAVRLPAWFESDTSWPSGDPANLALLADLESRFRPLENALTGTRVGIGVASGADSVFLTRDPQLIESERLLPVLTTHDTKDGAAAWSGTYLVNPWEDGRLIDLADYPLMERYLTSKNSEVHRRHVARKNPHRWYRTIDRVEPGLFERDKLVIPDLKAYIQPVLDRGETYPYHGLYFIVSDRWDLEVLGGLLLSDIAELFVAMYCVRMRGGCFRFQAQYLRRIRVPDVDTVGKRDQNELRKAFEQRDRAKAGAIARRLYGLSADAVVATG